MEWRSRGRVDTSGSHWRVSPQARVEHGIRSGAHLDLPQTSVVELARRWQVQVAALAHMMHVPHLQLGVFKTLVGSGDAISRQGQPNGELQRSGNILMPSIVNDLIANPLPTVPSLTAMMLAAVSLQHACLWPCRLNVGGLSSVRGRGGQLSDRVPILVSKRGALLIDKRKPRAATSTYRCIPGPCRHSPRVQQPSSLWSLSQQTLAQSCMEFCYLTRWSSFASVLSGSHVVVRSREQESWCSCRAAVLWSSRCQASPLSHCAHFRSWRCTGWGGLPDFPLPRHVQQRAFQRNAHSPFRPLAKVSHPTVPT